MFSVESHYQVKKKNFSPCLTASHLLCGDVFFPVYLGTTCQSPQFDDTTTLPYPSHIFEYVSLHRFQIHTVSQYIFLVTTISHAQLTTNNGIITTHLLRPIGIRSVRTKSASCASQLSGKMLHFRCGILPKQLNIS